MAVCVLPFIFGSRMFSRDNDGAELLLLYEDVCVRGGWGLAASKFVFWQLGVLVLKSVLA
jgi:hypothetical protein